MYYRLGTAAPHPAHTWCVSSQLVAAAECSSEYVQQ